MSSSSAVGAKRKAESVAAAPSSEKHCTQKIIKQSYVDVHGHGNVIKGNFVKVFGNENAVLGKNCVVFGRDNVIIGDNPKAIGFNNKIWGKNFRAKGAYNQCGGGEGTFERRKSNHYSANIPRIPRMCRFSGEMQNFYKDEVFALLGKYPGLLGNSVSIQPRADGGVVIKVPMPKEKETIFSKIKDGAQKTDVSEQQCCVCLDNKKDILFEPCLHVCTCIECAVDLDADGTLQCPQCRAKIDSAKRIFL